MLKIGDIEFEEADFNTSIKTIEKYIKELEGAHVFFDVDGTLCDYRFYSGHKNVDNTKYTNEESIVKFNGSRLDLCDDSEYTRECLAGNPYDNVRPLVIMKAIIYQLGVNNCFGLTTAFSSVEHKHKQEFVNKHYGIQFDHIFAVGRDEDKISFLKDYSNVNHTLVALIDDKISTLKLANEAGIWRAYHTSSFSL